ncbi:hypothetical protein BR93DRAFT_314160 [Coniochaeta sp. PMI_546]|nr:hypothetical protein BR93DRAFT_314160 [Coniochaeta sp. PMI_546]
MSISSSTWKLFCMIHPSHGHERQVIAQYSNRSRAQCDEERTQLASAVRAGRLGDGVCVSLFCKVACRAGFAAACRECWCCPSSSCVFLLFILGDSSRSQFVSCCMHILHGDSPLPSASSRLRLFSALPSHPFHRVAALPSKRALHHSPLSSQGPASFTKGILQIER